MALATLLNVVSTRLGRIADEVDALASLGGRPIGLAVPTLFVGALRAAASVLSARFEAALACIIAAIAAFTTGILMAGRGVRDEIDRLPDAVPERR